MKRFIVNIFKVSLSNVLSLISGILVGFLVPKMMGLEDYANYKIYTLYITYIAFLSLGFGDGLYLKFSGKDKSELDVNMLRYYIRKYYLQLMLFFLIAIILSMIFVPTEYIFISIALAFTILSSQITAMHQSLSLITSSFNEYSIRVIAKAALTSFFVLALFCVYKFKGTEISYIVYTCGILLIEFILAAWYIYTYKDFNFGLVKKADYTPKYNQLLFLGFPLLLSNMAATIFLNLDRQFVSILFTKNEYAIYAFAYNMLTLITTITSAVSLVLFPAMRKMQQIDIKYYFQKYMSPFNIVVSLCMVVYFPLCVFVPLFLPQYISSLEIFRIVLPGLILSTSVSVVLINFYKVEDKMRLYFIITLIAIIISIAFNYLAYIVFYTYQSISWASIGSIFAWYILSYVFFIWKYHVPFIKSTLYICIIILYFYVITGMINNVLIRSVNLTF